MWAMFLASQSHSAVSRQPHPPSCNRSLRSTLGAFGALVGKHRSFWLAFDLGSDLSDGMAMVSKEGRTVAPLVYPSKSGQSSKPTNPMTDKGPRSVPCFWQYLSEIKMRSTRHPVEAVDTMPTSLSCRDVIELIDTTPYFANIRM